MMLPKFSFVALMAATAFASVIPAVEKGTLSTRQEEWNIWFVSLQITNISLASWSTYMRFLMHSVRELSLYKSGCDDEETETFSGHDDQTFPCAGGSIGWHNVKMDNMEATGHKVILYSDVGCGNVMGRSQNTAVATLPLVM